MAEKGIIYVMTTAVTGLIKIGRTETRQFEQRMRNLESNGYYNVVGLKRYFAIEVEDYIDKEKLIHEIFNKHKVAESELFALDQEIIKQLLLCFEGRVIYPENVNQEKEFEKISKTRKKGELFSFYKKGLKNGDKISFIKDKSIVATVCGEREVEYNGQVWKLSPLTYKILEDRGELNESGAYQGAAYFEYNGKKLKDLPDIE
jgi:T5orf172 domain.